MKKLIIGIVLVVLGLPGTAYFFADLVHVIIGGLPVLLILAGALAAYLGYEEIQTEKEMEPETFEPDESDPAKETFDLPDSNIQKPTEPAEPEIPKTSAIGVVGNTDTHVFHSMTCNFAQGKKCTVQFADREEAIAQEFKPCKVCNP